MGLKFKSPRRKLENSDNEHKGYNMYNILYQMAMNNRLILPSLANHGQFFMSSQCILIVISDGRKKINTRNIIKIEATH